jgi:hypothetical protein
MPSYSPPARAALAFGARAARACSCGTTIRVAILARDEGTCVYRGPPYQAVVGDQIAVRIPEKPLP